MTEPDPLDDLEQVRQGFINAAANADAVRIGYLIHDLTTAGYTTFTYDDLLNQWLGTWPHHQYPPFKRRPAQRLPLALPIVMASAAVVAGDPENPDVRSVRWPTFVNFLANRIGLAVQLEQISVFATALDVDTPTTELIDELVAELVRLRGPDFAGEMVLTVEADVTPAGGQ